MEDAADILVKVNNHVVPWRVADKKKEEFRVWSNYEDVSRPYKLSRDKSKGQAPFINFLLVIRDIGLASRPAHLELTFCSERRLN